MRTHSMPAAYQARTFHYLAKALEASGVATAEISRYHLQAQDLLLSVGPSVDMLAEEITDDLYDLHIDASHR